MKLSTQLQHILTVTYYTGNSSEKQLSKHLATCKLWHNGKWISEESALLLLLPLPLPPSGQSRAKWSPTACIPNRSHQCWKNLQRLQVSASWGRIQQEHQASAIKAVDWSSHGSQSKASKTESDPPDMLCKECAQNVVSNNKTTRNSSFVLADKLQCKWRESNGTEQSWLSWVRIARDKGGRQGQWPVWVKNACENLMFIRQTNPAVAGAGPFFHSRFTSHIPSSPSTSSETFRTPFCVRMRRLAIFLFSP